MYVAANGEPIGPPRGPTGRLRIDMDKLLALHAEGYSPRQIAKVLAVSDYTVRERLRERLHPPLNVLMSMKGRKGQKGRRRSMARRKREAKRQAARQAAADAQKALITLGLLAFVADRMTPPIPKKDEPGLAYGP